MVDNSKSCCRSLLQFDIQLIPIHVVPFLLPFFVLCNRLKEHAFTEKGDEILKRMKRNRRESSLKWTLDRLAYHSCDEIMDT